jgi:L-2-hydroxyglutarate oxidase LhgO
MSRAKSIGIIGGGIVGLATALKLAQRMPEAIITVFEKEPSPGRHQSTHNSGVLHAGLYYKPGSAKARLAVSGLRQMLEFCRENNVPHEQCGKLVVATNAEEAGLLKGLFERGTANGLRGLRQMGPQEIAEREPHARGVAAIHVPEEGIVDYSKVIKAMAAKITGAGHRILTSWKINRIERRDGRWLLCSPAGEEFCDLIVNTAGLHCDRVSAMAGERRETRIIPFRGEYYRLRKESQHLVRHLIYPVPNPKFPFLGVHFTRLARGGIEAGPNAVLAFAREGYTKSDVNMLDLADTLTFSGFWRFAGRHRGMCWQELRQSFSKHQFVTALQKLVPEIRAEDLETGGAGVRAQAMRPDGTLVEDFQFIRRPGALHVLNAPSPAATASLAIADEVVNQIEGLND